MPKSNVFCGIAGYVGRTPLPVGGRFGGGVNGEVVFCNGVNIGPHDAILADPDQRRAALPSSVDEGSPPPRPPTFPHPHPHPPPAPAAS